MSKSRRRLENVNTDGTAPTAEGTGEQTQQQESQEQGGVQDNSAFQQSTENGTDSAAPAVDQAPAENAIDSAAPQVVSQSSAGVLDLHDAPVVASDAPAAAGEPDVAASLDAVLKAAESIAEIKNDLIPETPAKIETPVAEETKAAAPVVAEAVAPSFGAIGNRVMSILNDYVVKMAPRRPVTDAQILEQQRHLYDAMLKTINDSGEDFEALMNAVFAFFEKHKSGVFHETRVFRGMENVQMPENDRTAFMRFVNMFKLLANPQSRKLALKQIDLEATLQFGVTDNGRNRVMTFFNR